MITQYLYSIFLCKKRINCINIKDIYHLCINSACIDFKYGTNNTNTNADRHFTWRTQDG